MDALKKLFVVVAVSALVTGCSSTKHATDFNGMSSMDGKAVTHISTSNVALHLMLGKTPIAGDASLEKTVSDFTAAAKAAGASQVRIVQSSSRAWWFVFPPFSFFVTPVTSNVAGDVSK